MRLPCAEISRRIRMAAVFGIALSLLARSALADVVVLKDGRRYEGLIIKMTEDAVKIDTKVSGVRVSLGFLLVDVKSSELKPVPEGFFEKPPAEPRVSDPKKFKDGAVLYLEVPIIGALGKQVFADGLSQVLTYAKRNGIKHIVFTIDSEGGTVDEAREIYLLLKEHKDSIRYHGIIRKCTAEALVVGLWCRPGLLLPGGVLGGLPLKSGGSQKAEEVEEEEVIRSQMAQRAVSDTGATGHVAAFIRALVDPGEELAAWKDEEGNIGFDAKPPAGTPADRIIFQVGKGETLTITREQALALGMKKFEGSAADLGSVLKLPDWTVESEYGIKTMSRVGAQREKALQNKQAAHDEKVKKIATRRDAAELFIQDSIKQAAEWDPKKETYSTYSERYDMGYGWTGGWTSNKWTPESQRKWKTRTDATMYYLQEAAKGLRAMKRLDAEAVKVGLEPLYKPGEIDTIMRNLDIRHRELHANRIKSQE